MVLGMLGVLLFLFGSYSRWPGEVLRLRTGVRQSVELPGVCLAAMQHRSHSLVSASVSFSN